MRDYKHIDRYITELAGDIYPQPEDDGHTMLAQQVISHWMSSLPSCKSVLDVGCGTGFCQPMFEKWGVDYEGVAMGEDVVVAFDNKRNVKCMDFNFLKYPDESFDLVFSRHSFEHSFSPLLSLMEWNRVAKNWLGLVAPAPEHYTHKGQNHYFVLNYEQLDNILVKTGWHPVWKTKYPDNEHPMEYWIFCEKVDRKIK